MSQQENQNAIDQEIARLEALKKQQTQLTQQEDEVRKLINDSGKFARLPKSDGEKKIYQFFNDKSKRRIVEKTFTDPSTGQKREPQKRIEYDVLVPEIADQGEKLLDVPRSLASQIEDNLDRNHCLLEITRHGTGVTTQYTAIPC